MSDRAGQRIGNYQLVKLLGTGGFAEVYLGEHVYLKTQVAIKILHAKLGLKHREEFAQEAKTISKLRHQHIIGLLDFGIESDTTPYLIMDYAPQGTLRSKYPKGSILPLTTASTYVKQIAQGLQYAHDHNLIHRDLKPENILLGEQGEILVSDFGIAAIAHNTGSIPTGSYAGTIVYSAPEQINGKTRRESDQYSLGIIVYEWLSGNPPFIGTWREIMMQQLSVSPRPLPAISDEVNLVVMKALAKDPKLRFGSMIEFAKEYEQAYQKTISSTLVRKPLPDQQQNIKDKGIQPDQSSPHSQRGDRDTRRSSQHSDMQTPKVTQDINVSRQSSGSDTTSGQRTGQPSPTTTPGGSSPNRQEMASIDGETVLRRVRIGNIPSDWHIIHSDIDPWKTFLKMTVWYGVLGILLGIPISIGFQSFTTFLFTLLAATVLGCIVGFFSAIGASDKKIVVLMPEGYVYGHREQARVDHVVNFNDMLAVEARGRTVHVTFNQRHALKTLFHEKEIEYKVPGASVARKIVEAYLDYEKLHFEQALVENNPTGTSRQPPQAISRSAVRVPPPQSGSLPKMQSTLEPAKRGISRRTILGFGLAGLVVVGSGVIEWVLFVLYSFYTYRGHSFGVYAVAWSPDGKRIASAGGDSTVQVWDAANGGNVYTYSGHTNFDVNAVAWSPDGKRIASASADKTVQVWDAANGGNVYTYRGHSHWVWAVAWSPDGKRIASASADKTVQVWDAANGGNVYTYRGHTNAEYGASSVAWSPDGKRIASGSDDTTVQVWDAANGGNVYTYRGHSFPVYAVAWSPDGKRIASGSDDTTVQVWDAANGGNVYTYRGHSDRVRAVAWSPDGKRIASASADKTVQVWDAATGKHLLTYSGHSDAVCAVAWSPDGSRIASAGYDKTVQIWREHTLSAFWPPHLTQS